MKRPRPINRDVVLFIADSQDVHERLDTINRKILATLETIPQSWLQSFAWGPGRGQTQDSSLEDREV